MTVSDKTSLALIPLLVLGASVLMSRPAQAQTTVYTTFGAGNSFDSSSAYDEAGPSSTSNYQSVGSAFTVSQSGSLFSLTVAYGHYSGTDVGDLYLTDDLSKVGNTGASLESFTLTNLPAETGNPFTPEVLDSVVQPTLTVGTTYYLYGLETGNTADGFNRNDQGLNGTLVFSDNGGAYGTGSDLLPAFSVQIGPASTTPEPASSAAFVLGGLGLLGLGLKARRRKQDEELKPAR